MRMRPVDARAARETDGKVPMLTPANVAAFRRRAVRERHHADKFAVPVLEAVAGPWAGRHRAQPFVAGDQRLGLGERNLRHRAAFERSHQRAGIACRLALADAALVGDGRGQPSAGPIGALTARAGAIAAGGPQGVDLLAAGAASGRDLGSGVGAHGRSRLREPPPRCLLGRYNNGGRSHRANPSRRVAPWSAAPWGGFPARLAA